MFFSYKPQFNTDCWTGLWRCRYRRVCNR